MGEQPAEIRRRRGRLRRRRDDPRDLAARGQTRVRPGSDRDPAGFDGTGTFRNVSLPRLPPVLKLPPLESRLAGKYQVHQDARGWRANVVLDAIHRRRRVDRGRYHRLAGSTSGRDDVHRGWRSRRPRSQPARSTARSAVSRGRAVPQPARRPLQRRRARRLCRSAAAPRSDPFTRPRRWPRRSSPTRSSSM